MPMKTYVVVFSAEERTTLSAYSGNAAAPGAHDAATEKRPIESL
jgi:hypothetical protein